MYVQNELISKEEEIQNLKTRLKEPSLNSSLSSLPKDEPEKEHTPALSHLAALQRALNDREAQLMDVQSHLQIATKEMEAVIKMYKFSDYFLMWLIKILGHCCFG